MARVLFELLLKTKENPTKEELRVIQQTFEFLGLKKDDMKNMSSEDIIRLFKNEESGMDKLELAGFLLLRESKKEKEPEQLRMAASAADILKYVDRNSGCYSLERQIVLSGM